MSTSSKKKLKLNSLVEIKLMNNKPNLKYKENIINDFLYRYWICETFDIYYSEINSNGQLEPYIVYANYDSKDINILRISDKKKIKSLKGHLKTVYLVKYFYNQLKKNHILLSVDYQYIILVWDLNKFENINKIITSYIKQIYCLLVIFEYNFIITSNIENKENQNNYSRIYSLSSGKFIKNIPDTSKNETLYLLYWNLMKILLLNFAMKK